MVIIEEKNGKFLNFFKPLMVVGAGGMLLNFLSFLISLVIIFIGPSFPLDIVITNLLILLFSQIIGIFIVYYVFIPIFKAKNVEYRKFTISNSLRTALLICGTFTLIVCTNFILIFIFSSFNLIPQSGYTNILLDSGHLANPLNILIYYLPVTIGAPIFEELVYRRLLIPLLEKRGMKPLTAIISSSFVFAIAHLPGDLLNGNLSGGIIHISGVFLIGVSLGLIYSLTRNVIFPIIIHGVLNFISFSGPLVILIGDSTLILSYYIIYWTIFIAGFGVLLFGLWQFFKKQTAEWIILLRKKVPKRILYGFIGFIILGIFIVFIPLMIELAFLSLGLAAYNALLYLIAIIISNGSILILFSWLGTKTRYESNTNLI
jgi:membrane protease YdiL (CAAX protease family)